MTDDEIRALLAQLSEQGFEANAGCINPVCQRMARLQAMLQAPRTNGKVKVD